MLAAVQASLSFSAPASGLPSRVAAPTTRAADPSMCGILATVNSKLSPEALRLQTLTLQRLIRHRGPDGSGINLIENSDGTCSAIAHERLAIVDPLAGNQPLYSKDRKLSLAINGEIYNHKELRAEINDESKFRTNSDCEPVVHLYEQIGHEVASKLDGDFAFVIVDEVSGEVYAARDPIGVNSLYWGTGLDGATWFSSEAKALVTGGCINIEMFPPGYYYSSKNAHVDNGLTRFYNPAWFDVAAATGPIDLPRIRDTFMTAVKKRMMADVPYGVLLSPGSTRRSAPRSSRARSGSATCNRATRAISRSSSLSPLGSTAALISPRPRWWLSSSVPSTTASRSPCRRVSMPSPT